MDNLRFYGGFFVFVFFGRWEEDNIKAVCKGTATASMCVFFFFFFFSLGGGGGAWRVGMVSGPQGFDI